MLVSGENDTSRPRTLEQMVVAENLEQKVQRIQGHGINRSGLYLRVR